jgi:hypothetical protein
MPSGAQAALQRRFLRIRLSPPHRRAEKVAHLSALGTSGGLAFESLRRNLPDHLEFATREAAIHMESSLVAIDGPAVEPRRAADRDRLDGAGLTGLGSERCPGGSRNCQRRLRLGADQPGSLPWSGVVSVEWDRGRTFVAWQTSPPRPGAHSAAPRAALWARAVVEGANLRPRPGAVGASEGQDEVLTGGEVGVEVTDALGELIPGQIADEEERAADPPRRGLWSQDRVRGYGGAYRRRFTGSFALRIR